MLKRMERSATVRAVGRLRLLVLDADDLRALIAREPGIAKKIDMIVHRRGQTVEMDDAVKEASVS